MRLRLVGHHAPAIVQAALALFVFGMNRTAASAQPTATESRVRSESPSIRTAIADGIERSPTFRRLVETVGATDGIVYVQEGRCQFNVRACLHLSVGLAGRYRFLRILVTSRKAPGCELISSIGHELQHAVEALSNPKVTSAVDMFQFFDRKKPAGWADTFETNEAVRAGLLVDKEMCK